jgi:hypothetical protein
MTQETILMMIVGAVIVWQVNDYFRTRTKEKTFQQAQEYINSRYEEKISDLVKRCDHMQDEQSKDVQDRVLFRQSIMDGIKDIKTEIALLKDFLMRDIADHEKRLETIEKKIFV